MFRGCEGRTTMQVGVIKEIKDQEHRVALTPAGAKALHQVGHTVLVQAGAGLGSGFLGATVTRAQRLSRWRRRGIPTWC
jgi:hypothetical protein